MKLRADVILPCVLIAACLALVGFIATDCARGEWSSREVVVVDRVYTPARSSTGIGLDSRGRAIVTTSSEAEEWNVIVSDYFGTRVVTVNAATWTIARPGAHLLWRFKVGHWTHGEWWGCLTSMPDAE